MPIIYNDEIGRTDDTETGASITDKMVHPSGHVEYTLTINDKTFSIPAEVY